MWMPDNPADIPTWVQETLAIAQHSIYVSDRGKVYCSDPMCRCDGEAFGVQMSGRRHALGCLVMAILKHRAKWLTPDTIDQEKMQPDLRECCSDK